MCNYKNMEATNDLKDDIFERTINLSDEIETEGFNVETGRSWVYPLNYPIRDYQYSIVQEALFKNTLVSLPTGLGKTFIAAVVMYNFYRWYPTGKIIFIAPTRPLVKQQVDACYNITAIPKEVTAELTGAKTKLSRGDVWKDKRVFFITPQILQNDLESELATKIKCLVFDEAHKAKKDHAYCEVMRKLLVYNKYFRVLALSATPGNNLEDISDVLKNLLISHIELRTDESADVVPYTFERTLETVIVSLDEKLEQVRDDYIKVLERYTRILIKHRIVTGNVCTLTRGKIFMLMKDYQSKNVRDKNSVEILRNLNICITLYHAFDLLIRHGLRGFLSFFEEHISKPLLQNNADLHRIMEDVREYLGPAPIVQTLPDGTVIEVPENARFGHPKFYKLRDVLTDHFKNLDEKSTKAIVFFEYKESVMEAFGLLLQHRPQIRPRVFVGQGSITQLEQIRVVKAFREGTCNTLLSTCIGEEGLDVGEVDLIVCFDITNKSPVRMIQRMGRTGRKRQGRVIVLVTQGKEEQTLKECLYKKNYLSNNILSSKELSKSLYTSNPRMVPTHIIPECQKMHITIPQTKGKETKIKKPVTLKDFFNSASNSNTVVPEIDDIEVIEVKDHKPEVQELNKRKIPSIFKSEKNKTNSGIYLDKAKTGQKQGKRKIQSSKISSVPVAPQLTQKPVENQVFSPSKNLLKTSSFKQNDIRSMFDKISTSEKEDCVIIESNEIFLSNSTMPDELVHEIKNYLSIVFSLKIDSSDELFKLSTELLQTNVTTDLTTWTIPDVKILDDITLDSFQMFDSHPTSTRNESETVCDLLENFLDLSSFADISNMSNSEKKFKNNNERLNVEPINCTDSISHNKKNKTNYSDSLGDKKYSPGKHVPNIRNENCDEGKFFVNSSGKPNTPCIFNSSYSWKRPENLHFLLNKISSEKLKGEDKVLISTSKAKIETENINSPDAVLSFFKLDSLSDLLNTSKDNVKVSEIIHNSSNTSSVTYSPILFRDESPILTYSQYTRKDPDCSKQNVDNKFLSSNDNSPVLSSQVRATKLKNNAKKQLFLSSSKDLVQNSVRKPKLSNLTKCEKGSSQFEHLPMSTRILGGDMNSSNNVIKFDSKKKVQNCVAKPGSSELQDFFDFSVFEKAENLNKIDKKCHPNHLQEIRCQNDAINNKMVNENINKTGIATRAVERRNSDDIDNFCDFFTFNMLSDTTNNNANGVKRSLSDNKFNDDILPPCKRQKNDDKLSTTETIVLSDSSIESPIKKDVSNEISSSPAVTHIFNLENKKFVNINQENMYDELSANKSGSLRVSTDQINRSSDNKQSDGGFSKNHNIGYDSTASTSLKKENVNLNPFLSTTVEQQKVANDYSSPKKVSVVNDFNNYEEFRNYTTKNKKHRKPPVNNINTSSSNCDSSDKFETTPEKRWISKKLKNTQTLKHNISQKCIVKKKTSAISKFIIYEAEVSEESIVISDDEEVEDDSIFESSFVNDETQDFGNCTQVQAHYFSSVKNNINSGQFKIPALPQKSMKNVCSQIEDYSDNTYLEDSFCVDDDCDDSQELPCSSQDMSLLEKAEKILEEERKQKKRQKLGMKEKSKKRKRIKIILSDSD